MTFPILFKVLAAQFGILVGSKKEPKTTRFLYYATFLFF